MVSCYLPLKGKIWLRYYQHNSERPSAKNRGKSRPQSWPKIVVSPNPKLAKNRGKYRPSASAKNRGNSRSQSRPKVVVSTDRLRQPKLVASTDPKISVANYRPIGSPADHGITGPQLVAYRASVYPRPPPDNMLVYSRLVRALVFVLQKSSLTQPGDQRLNVDFRTTTNTNGWAGSLHARTGSLSGLLFSEKHTGVKAPRRAARLECLHWSEETPGARRTIGGLTGAKTQGT
ncbi:hypothetical protein J6590_015342 [Homalodisca vitripennis]|nr:hypothetical protein J6590_015342 [Homalodisca vitripennis]